jgi:hypothetical protein
MDEDWGPFLRQLRIVDEMALVTPVNGRQTGRDFCSKGYQI